MRVDRRLFVWLAIALLTGSCLVALTTAIRSDQASAAPGDVPFWVYKVHDQADDNIINLSVDPRIAGADFSLYLNGSTTATATGASSLVGLHPSLLTFDPVGAGPVGAAYTICELPQPGWGFDFSFPFAGAADPGGLGRSCIAGTITSGDAALGRVEIFVANKPDVPFWVYKVHDQDDDGSINLSVDPRLADAQFALYLNGATTPTATGTSTFIGLHPSLLTFDPVGAGPVGAAYTICELPQPGWGFDFSFPFAGAPDPGGLGRSCTAGTITSGDAALGRVEIFFANQPHVPFWVYKVHDQDDDDAIDLALDPRVVGANFSLYLNGSTTAAATGTSSFAGVQPGLANTNLVGGGPVGATYTICETPQPGWSFDFSSPTAGAPDPAGLGRSCIADIITAGHAALGRVEIFFANQPHVPFWVYKVHDQDDDDAIDLALDPRVVGANFSLYLNGSTTAAATGTSSFAGVQPGLANTNLVGGGPVGATYTMCETPQPGWSFDFSSPSAGAPDPAGLGRSCIADIITAGHAALGRVEIFFANKPGVVVPQFCRGLLVTIDMTIGASGLGTAGDDVIFGTAGADVIDGMDGHDTICGNGGNDTISGGGGVDYIYGGDGNDTLTGGDGNDRIRGQQGIDTINGGPGNDFLYGGVEGDTITGGEGHDVIGGFGGNDIINAGPGNDIIFGGFGADLINAGDGRDTVFGLIGNDTINGDAGNDILNGDNGQDTINGGPGNDTINGGNSLDTLNGDDGNDNLNGGKADDKLSGGPGTDVCTGNKHTIGDTADATCETTFGIP